MSLDELDSRSGQLLRKFDLNLLIVFEALITECHVTRAAKKVYLSQPAVSHALNRMRDELGDPLLVRTDKGMLPTPRALEMLPAVQQALKLLEATLSPPQPFDPATSTRRFVIATTDYFELVHYPALVARLREQAPNVSVEIQLIADQVLRAGLENREVDLVVGLESYHDIPKRLLTEPWVTDELVCLAGQSNDLVMDTLSLDAFIQQPHVVFTDVAGARPNAVDLWLEQQGLKRRSVSCNLSYAAAARIVSMSDAIITLPRQMAELFTQMLPVKLVAPPEGLGSIDMSVIHHPLYTQDPAIAWMIEQVKQDV
ncbi:LysR family transcriptional regulator [Pontibacterium granulatum]|uniref:LysR family transcriptional regulator n=1 Tax=Pontibacterium granulatum TaxID=2036029 RepID=UPI00249C7FAD|nr:LysR family transcriptional regulator [Pontibacterium granulatum]